jgi:hypothetical protein
VLIADGNPLFIEELIRDLVESGHLARDGEGYALTRQAEEIDLPTTVQGLFLARADRPAPELRNLLQVASVLGRVFNFPLLRAVAGLQRDELERALLQLEDLDFVYQSALAPERQYSFKQVLAQEAISQTLVRSRREAHHAGVGAAIEALYSDRFDEWIENPGPSLHPQRRRCQCPRRGQRVLEEAMRILDRAQPWRPVGKPSPAAPFVRAGCGLFDSAGTPDTATCQTRALDPARGRAGP